MERLIHIGDDEYLHGRHVYIFPGHYATNLKNFSQLKYKRTMTKEEAEGYDGPPIFIRG